MPVFLMMFRPGDDRSFKFPYSTSVRIGRALRQMVVGKIIYFQADFDPEGSLVQAILRSAPTSV